MTDRNVISDALWEQIEPLLPSMKPQRGGRWTPHRMVLEGIAWRFRTGTPWRDVPERFGSWNTLHKRHSRWADDGTYARLHRHLLGEADSDGELDWLVSVDSTIVRAHQHAAGARREDALTAAGHTGGTIELQGSARRAS
jgi:transposase